MAPEGPNHAPGRTSGPESSTEVVRVGPVNLGPAERLQEALTQLRDRVDGIRGVAVADKSGLPVSSAFSTHANILTVTAMATMAIQSSQRVYQNLGLVGPSEVVMVGPDSTVFVYSVADGQLSVIVVLDGFANLGLVRIEVERLSRELSEILGI